MLCWTWWHYPSYHSYESSATYFDDQCFGCRKLLKCGWFEMLLIVLEKENFTINNLLPQMFSQISVVSFKKRRKRNKCRSSFFHFRNCYTIIQLYLNCPTMAAVAPVLKCKRSYMHTCIHTNSCRMSQSFVIYFLSEDPW